MSQQRSHLSPAVLSRLFAPDALRGLVMVLMALDHANLFIAHKHPAAEMWGGPFPMYYDALTFVTRLVTHLCPTGFFFLLGVGMALLARSYLRRGWSKWAITRHLAIRGALLMAIQLLIVNRAWVRAPGGWGIETYVGVLFALGLNMILGSLLLWLKPGHLLGLTAVLVLAAEWLVPAPSAWGPGPSALEHILLVPGGVVGPQGQVELWCYYSVLHWLELVTFGLVFGQWLKNDAGTAFGRAWKLGLALLGAFLLVRYIDGFGNIRPRMGDTWIDFLNVVKYPPSIAYTSLTLGVNLLLLGALGRAGPRAQGLLQPLAVLGRAPLLFYVLHLFLYAWMGERFTPNGTSIPAMWPYWLLGVLILWPLCLWYSRFKRRQPLGSLVRYF
jgi:uncharacterized membrane protein